MSVVTARQNTLRVLGVYAHPDDETFCTGGTLAKYAAAGAEVMVVSATRGEAGQIRDARAATRRTLGQVRVQEMHQACQHLGVQHIVCLDYGDGNLSHLDPSVLVAHITEIIRAFRPDIMLTFGRDGMYGHPDHITIGAATDRAFELAGDTSAFPEHRTRGLRPHAPARLYHSCLPRPGGLLLQLLVDWLHRLDERFRGTPEFVRGLLSLAEATCTLGYSRDALHVAWYPPGVSIIEQGEPATSLYLILSGHADVVREAPDGTLHKVNEIGPGAFFGEEGIAAQQPRNANIIARDSVSCMVLSPGEPTRYAGRGQHAQHFMKDSNASAPCAATTCIEVSAYVPQKMAAMASYRTQCPMPPDLLPQEILREMFAHEYFVRVYPALEVETELYPSHLLRLHPNFKRDGASDVHQFNSQLSGA